MAGVPEIDITATVRSLDRARSNIQFGIARGLTQVARLAAQDVTAALPSTFDRPNPFTMQAVTIEPAAKDTLAAAVLVKDAQARYLEIEETGGTRTPQPGAPVNLPADINLNQYGNIPRGAIALLKSRKDVFIFEGKGKLPAGVYQRVSRGPRGQGYRFKAVGKKLGAKEASRSGEIRLLIAFRKRAVYRPRFHFRDQVDASFQRRAAAILECSINDALTIR